MPVINTFVIVNVINLTDEMIDQSLNSSTSMRKNNDETKCVLKFSGICYPSSCVGLIKYDYEEIMEILTEQEWVTEVII